MPVNKRHYRNYTDQQLIEAVSQSKSIAQVLIKLGIAPKGGNYRSIHKIIKSHQLDISHFTGMLWNKGIKLGPKRPVNDYLSNEFPISSHRLRQRLISEGIFEYKCSNCNLDKWLEDPIPLELEHKDGNHENNALSNLCLLCPNCHTLTPTYRGKNKKRISSALPY